MSDSLKPRRPYLLRAMHEWIEDSGHTPHIVVDAGIDGVDVPHEHIRDGRIVLNIGYGATDALLISNEAVTCSARFSGNSRDILVPMNAVLGIYASETGQGMIFTEDESGPEPPPGKKENADRPKLKIVK
ncbi:MAG: ClpXP protease specificity-enhancing factor [Gammaproteobacteria bacterium]